MSNVFISYSWKTKDLADKIALDLQLFGVSVIKDNQHLSYTDSIVSFMKRIRSCDYALLLVSDGYLKSKNCLYEILELQKDEDHWDKVLPVVCDGTNIYSALDRLHYVNYWEQKTKELEVALEGVDPINSIEAYKELKLFKNITSSIDEFMKAISDVLHFSPSEIFAQNYRCVIEKLGIEINPKSLIELLNIVSIENLEQREIALDTYIVNNPETGYYYSIKAGTARDLAKFDQAIHFYQKGLDIDPTNYELLNNLGRLLEHKKEDIENAKILYERAIQAMPNVDIARLNLGVLLKRCFNDEVGAKEQYEAILAFDPNNPRAHNNLSNYYKSVNATAEELDQAEFHMKKAIESDPEYIDALFNYGNFLKVRRKKIDEGNKYYERILEIDKEGNLKEILELLMKSNKG